MDDLDQLREALTNQQLHFLALTADLIRVGTLSTEHEEWTGETKERFLVLEAASELLALEENGQTVWVCQEHKVSQPNLTADCWYRRWWVISYPGVTLASCRMVEAVLHIHQEGT